MQNYALSLLFTLLGLFSAVVQAAQVADKDFHPQVATPAFSTLTQYPDIKGTTS